VLHIAYTFSIVLQEVVFSKYSEVKFSYFVFVNIRSGYMNSG
jgi:hypothetical protein